MFLEKAQQVFAPDCPDWTLEDYTEAQTLVSGIEYGTMIVTANSVPLDSRVTAAVQTILTVYQVPEEIREQKLKKVLSMDYSAIGRAILREFKQYIETVNEQALQEIPDRAFPDQAPRPQA